MSLTPLPQKLLHILVVDDHEIVLNGTINALQQQYPTAEIHKALSVIDALEKLDNFSNDLIILDLSLPENPGEMAKPDIGIQLLRNLLTDYPALSIMVQSANIRTLIRLRPDIYEHQGGFTVVDKSLSLKTMLTRVDWALQGLIYTPKEMRSGLELKAEWLTLLELAFNQGLQDKEIAKRLCVAERTVRHYWTKVQDALEVYPETGKNVRIQTEIRAREEGLLD